jgi:uridylate kinase
MKTPEFAISLGGSVITPDCPNVNTKYLLKFADLLHDRIETDRQRTAIVTGGGPIARMYRNALVDAKVINFKQLDSIGIHITHVHASMLTEILNATGVRAQYLEKLGDLRDPTAWVWTTGGNKVGQNTDATLVDWVQILGFDTRTLINITNTSYVYKLDVNNKPDLKKPIRDMTWDQYSRMVGQHEPGEHLPWGSTATKKARGLDFRVITVGPDLKNLKALFEGNPFEGTTIHP